jgi:V/A-type H+/Na+-transporting ATPase subunit A
LQQNGFDEVDAATGQERQKYVFGKVIGIMKKEVKFTEKKEAIEFFHKLRYRFIDWNYKQWGSSEFTAEEREVDRMASESEEDLIHNAGEK